MNAGLRVHPQANRLCELEGVPVSYEFRRARRKTVGLVVNTQGLSVRAPAWVPEAEVQRFLHTKARWVVAKLQAVNERASAAPLAWLPGQSIPLWGQPVKLSVVSSPHGAAPEVCASAEGLRVSLPSADTPDAVRHAVQVWLMSQARPYLAARLDHFAPTVGVRWTALRLSHALTRWGSAHAHGAIHLSWRLLHLAPDLIDYVVVHELCHLREMNHSPAFWRLVEAVLPDQAARRRALRAVPLFALT